MGAESFEWLKGHGTENDFVLLPDPDGTVHADLDDELVRFLCGRHAGRNRGVRGRGPDGQRVLQVTSTLSVSMGYSIDSTMRFQLASLQ